MEKVSMCMNILDGVRRDLQNANHAADSSFADLSFLKASRSSPKFIERKWLTDPTRSEFTLEHLAEAFQLADVELQLKPADTSAGQMTDS